MRAHASMHYVLFLATLFLTSMLSCSRAWANQTPAPSSALIVCPRTLFLQTLSVRVVQTSDLAENMLHSACILASQKALAAWRLKALTSPHADVRACAAKMGAQGCLLGQAYSSRRCTGRSCPQSQSCAVTLIRFDAGYKTPKA